MTSLSFGGIYASVTWKAPTNGVPVTGYEVSSSGVCDTYVWQLPSYYTQMKLVRRASFPGACTAKVRSVNDAGVSAWSASVTAVI